jgi:hypothetical protein
VDRRWAEAHPTQLHRIAALHIHVVIPAKAGIHFRFCSCVPIRMAEEKDQNGFPLSRE